MPEDNKAIVRRVIEEVINGGNLALVDSLVGADYVYHGTDNVELRGTEGFQQLIGMYRGAFPDLNLTIEDMIAEGDTVAIRWTARGTHRGDLMGIAPTGKSVTVSGIIVSRLSGGRIVEDFENFDEVALLRQLGATTLPAATVSA